eukprot:Gb_28526 [translate_table: standard]
MKIDCGQSSCSLGRFNISTYQGLVAAQQCLLHTNQKAKEIGASLHKCGHRLQQMKHRTEALESVMAPLLSQSRQSQELTESIRRAVGPAMDVLEAFISIRDLETALMGDPRDNIKAYLGAVSKLEGYLVYVSEKRPLAVELLEEAVRVSGCSRLNDKYRMRRLNGAIEALRMDGNNPEQDRGLGLMDLALQKLESSFRSVLAENSAPKDLRKSLVCSKPEENSLSTSFFFVKNLRLIVDCLRNNGRGQKCLKMYWDIRNRTVKESFQTTKPYYLNYNSSETIKKLNWADLEGHISDWLRLLEVVVRDLLSSERQLCSQIFQNFDREVWTECFGKLASGGGMDSLMQFGEAIAVTQREPQKLFKLLDMIEGLENLKEDLEKVFEGFGCMETRLRLRELQKQLVHSSCQILSDFSKQIEEDSGLPVDGSLPKITSYVVNYLKFLVAEYQAVMTRVLEMENHEMGLTQAVVEVFKTLERNLEARSKGYTEPALAHIFLMNNYWYIFKRARDSELAFVGEAWLKERRRWVNQHVLGYEKQEWGPLVMHLSREGLIGSGGRGAKDLFKQRLRAFNLAFDQIYETHRYWVISDDELREGTFVKIVQALIPAYRSYTETFSHLLDNTMSGNKYFRYTPEQLEDLLADMFAEKSSRIPNRATGADMGPASA